MKFTRIPDDFTAVGQGVVFAFDTELDPADVDMRIIDARTDETFAMKRFFNTSTGSADIARQLRGRMRFAPAAGTSGLLDATERTVAVEVGIGGLRTPQRTILPAERSATVPGFATAMPRQRTIAPTEWDELTLCTDEAAIVELTLRGAAEVVERRYLTPAAGVYLFRFYPSEFRIAPATATIALRTSKGVADTVEYTFAEPPAEAVRIAWRSSAGSIEHYTFPVESERIATAERQRIRTADAGFRTVAVGCERQQRLLSDYEPEATLEALAEIVAAPEVWRITQGRYEAVDPLVAEVVVREHGAPKQMELRLRDARKETRI